MILHTSIQGKGEPIVFLHTGLQTGLTDFEYQRAFFQRHYQVISPDLRGHGHSVVSNFSNFFDESANDLFETLEHVGIDSAHIVGGSIGALVAIIFAKKHPKKVKSLTISGIMPLKPDNWEELHLKDIEQQSHLLQKEEVADYFNQIHRGDWREALLITQDSTWYPFHEIKDIHALKMPILCIVGEGKRDEIEGACYYQEINSNMHIAVVPFAAHLVQDEQPEIHTKMLDSFLMKYGDANIKMGEES
ncbi:MULTISPECIES: alpha/beta fold hydrolase [Bacillaceae]|uniref:alpha/beta fold hydrolase n=1 Tax=Bacillaceae TaxID=186817 RepID=UPI001F27635C|nr:MULTISPECIES: alpha/beta hydrolase [Bacillaceae]MCF2647898.1 alpha/beta hydrolase [Niallia circulans]CAI9394031.1 AB hydrolase superfamily protein YvaM [Bacillus sp. T2.9-1]